MRFRIEWLIMLGLLLVFITGCGQKIIVEKASLSAVETELSKLALVEVGADLSQLNATETEVIKLLVRAGLEIDDLFLEQVYENNEKMMDELKSSEDAYLSLFKANFGPWIRLSDNTPFLNQLAKPAGANYYPVDMTKSEFEEWLEAHPDDKEPFESNFTVIRRKGDALVAIPYSEYYRDDLKEVAALLRKAAGKTTDPSLATFLKSRAGAFLSNDYFQSDMDWMDLSGDIEVVIGPYEVYEDGLFGYKAAFECFVCVVDHGESEKLDVVGSQLNELEDALPIPDQHKNFNRGSSSPFKVVNEIFAGGDTKAGAQTLAFNLPNDERVREAKGSKKVMLKNVMRAKFDKIYMPIVREVLAEKDLKRVSFDGYFNHILMHEVSHGLGPGIIRKNGRETTVNRELSDLYSVLEECKADVLGLYTLQILIDKGIFAKSMENTIYASDLGGMFRSIRFGIGRSHGGGTAMQLNYYLDKGAFQIDTAGRFSVNDRRMKKAVKEFARELLLIQALGDYQAAKRFIDTYRIVRPEVQAALDRLGEVPVDIRPVYTIEKQL